MAKEKTKQVKQEKVSKRTEPTKKELCEQYGNDGYTVKEIAEKAGTTVNSVRWYLSKARIPTTREEKPIKEAKATVKKQKA
jgi:DNA-directed RNA polymerase specialized sigma24 family protein